MSEMGLCAMRLVRVSEMKYFFEQKDIKSVTFRLHLCPTPEKTLLPKFKLMPTNTVLEHLAHWLGKRSFTES